MYISLTALVCIRFHKYDRSTGKKKLVTTLNVGIDRHVHQRILISIPPVRNYKKKLFILFLNRVLKRTVTLRRYF